MSIYSMHKKIYLSCYFKISNSYHLEHADILSEINHANKGQKFLFPA